MLDWIKKVLGIETPPTESERRALEVLAFTEWALGTPLTDWQKRAVRASLDGQAMRLNHGRSSQAGLASMRRPHDHYSLWAPQPPVEPTPIYDEVTAMQELEEWELYDPSGNVFSQNNREL